MAKKYKHGYNILAGLFGGFGDAASEYARLKEKKGDTEEDLLNSLSQISLKHQMNQLDPYNQTKMKYLEAQTAKLQEPSAWEQKLQVVKDLYGPSSAAEMTPEQIGNKQRSKLIDMYSGAATGPIPTQRGTVADLLANKEEQNKTYERNLSTFLGVKGSDTQHETLISTIKELNKTDPLINSDKYNKLLQIIVKIMGPEEALDAGFIDQMDLDSGALEDFE